MLYVLTLSYFHRQIACCRACGEDKMTVEQHKEVGRSQEQKHEN